MRRNRDRWNHNIHYYDLVADAVPSSARTALDVGTGDGLLATRLARTVPEVTGIDSDAAVIERARRSAADALTTTGASAVSSGAVSWIVGDILTHDLPEAHYDAVVAVATVHHFPDLAVGLRRLAALTAPGGTLVLIGLARSSTLHDRVLDAAGVVEHQVYSRTRGFWQHSAPVQMSLPHTYTEVREIAAAELPGAQWRRLPLWRYALIWKRSRR
ncbi:class I SAM-dependent methyltransferase [Gordonia sp. ABSL1-1]|uniref:class I SAM-dependent methyltransferase n=1 Tax=Gordonia sp. ABSL1-1 TaxID=3053923 RepID=UPI00257462C4|nr:class I SAM-dependent methyltransferase [Gordonia sp. ABSL1-1]MDL9937362.1 class I SAM-dependent methyltransferase [Gordonia sp. ABSL1-1]